MNTLQMEVALMRYFDVLKTIIVPCVQGSYNMFKFEVDLVSITKSGYATGVEIKVSKSDLKNDLKKRHIIESQNPLFRSYDGESGMEYFYGGFKYFYYAVPEKLKDESLKQINPNLGLLIIKKHPTLENYFLVKIERESKVLSKRKLTIEEQLKIARLGCIRILKYKSQKLK